MQLCLLLLFCLLARSFEASTLDDKYDALIQEIQLMKVKPGKTLSHVYDLL